VPGAIYRGWEEVRQGHPRHDFESLLQRPEVRVTVIELVAGDSMMTLYPLRFTGEEDCAALPTVVAAEAAAPHRATAGVSRHVGGRKEARAREVGGHA
jgi:hypothetical protein